MPPHHLRPDMLWAFVWVHMALAWFIASVAVAIAVFGLPSPSAQEFDAVPWCLEG